MTLCFKNKQKSIFSLIIKNKYFYNEDLSLKRKYYAIKYFNSMKLIKSENIKKERIIKLISFRK
jgi:hypothetical protein